jgi:hypothetical protein
MLTSIYCMASRSRGAARPLNAWPARLGEQSSSERPANHGKKDEKYGARKKRRQGYSSPAFR